MHVAGIMDHFSSAPKVELVVWCSTVGSFVSSGFRTYGQFKKAKLTAGETKPGSTGPRIWTRLALWGQFVGFFGPPLVYWTTTVYNKFQQSGWVAEYALPSPPDVFGVDGLMVGKMAGLLMYFAGGAFGRAAMKILGDQYSPIGIKEKPRLVDSGPFAYVRHPLYTASIITEASLALAFWSWIPLYALPITLCACILKVPIEERTLEQDPQLGKQYKAYKLRVPYGVIPYIW